MYVIEHKNETHGRVISNFNNQYYSITFKMITMAVSYQKVSIFLVTIYSDGYKKRVTDKLATMAASSLR